MIRKIDSKGWLRLFSAVALVASGAAMTSCSVYLPTHAQAAPPQPAPLYDWHGDNLAGATTVKIHLDEQKAYIFRGGQEAGWTMLASGKIGHDSPTGSFNVMEKIEHKTSNLYGVIEDSNGDVVNSDARAGETRVPPGCHFVGASMPYWMRLTSTGVGMHAGYIPDPGMPASHGCIRLPVPMAEKLFNVIGEGAHVEVTGIAPGSTLAGAPPAKIKPSAPKLAVAPVASPAPRQDLAQR
jgi:L,D-transpeptidase-like protein